MKPSEINRRLRSYGKRLFKKAIDLGLPIIYEENGSLVRLHKGNKKTIKKIKKNNIRLPKYFTLN